MILTPGLQGRAILQPTAKARMLQAALKVGTHEACGLLFGANVAGQVDIREASVARNVSDQPERRFEIDPAHLFEAQRRSRKGPERLIGCWHSHPCGNPLPSVHDRAGVIDMNWLWLIVAQGQVRAFRPLAQGFAEVALDERIR